MLNRVSPPALVVDSAGLHPLARGKLHAPPDALFFAVRRYFWMYTRHNFAVPTELFRKAEAEYHAAAKSGSVGKDEQELPARMAG